MENGDSFSGLSELMKDLITRGVKTECLKVLGSLKYY